MKVPHCNECEYCSNVGGLLSYLYCKKENKQICADWTIKTSPKWCPKRIIKEEVK